MMKDLDTVSRCIDTLVHQCNMTAIRLHVEDVTKRPFAYIFDVLFAALTNVMLKFIIHSPYPLLYHSLFQCSLFIIAPLNSLQYFQPS